MNESGHAGLGTILEQAAALRREVAACFFLDPDWRFAEDAPPL
jgi:hypothetical protein